MKIIETGRQLGQAVKNVQRLRQIIFVFARHGFVDLVDRMDLGKFIPGRLGVYAESQADKSLPERLKLAFEELGPTFVKLGQLLSTRSDLLPESFIEQFTQLQDNVQPLPFDTVRKALELELNKKIEETYSFFDPEPLAAASIGQVHNACLLTGEKVVVKIQRPEIEKIIDTDISLLAFLAGLLEKYVPETRFAGPKMIVDEFFRTLSYELDYLVEANNMTKFAENLSSMPEIVIPHVYRPYCTRKILTLERLEGLRLNDLKSLDAMGVDRKKLVEMGAKAFFKTILIDGLFHGDLHGGNLFVLSGNRLGIIDFGIVGRLSQKSRDQLANMVMALVCEDYETLCYEYAELGASGSSIDFEGFQREVRNSLSPYTGLPLSDINVGMILIEATKIAAKYNIKIPGDWMIVFKAMITVEGLGRTLDPNFDLLVTGQSLVKDLVKSQYSIQRLSKEFFWVTRDVASLLKVIPRQMKWMFRKFNSNDFAFEIKSPDFQSIKAQLDTNGRRMSSSILTGSLFIASSIALQSHSEGKIGNYPSLFVVYFGLGCVFLAGIFLKSFKK